MHAACTGLIIRFQVPDAILHAGRRMNMPKVLVIEDDKEINRLICEYLATVGYDTVSILNGMEGLNALKERDDIDICLLDLMLPYQSGDRVLSKLREFSQLPVIVLSAKDTVQTKIDLIRMGADDYITKPFDLDEVLVRMEAVLKRTAGKDAACGSVGEGGKNNIISFKKLCMDMVAKTITVDGNRLDLTVKEYAILELFLTNPTKLFSKANLFESVWSEPYYADDNTLKVHMSNIRNKIKKYDDDEYIETIWGMGYKLKK